MLSGSGRVHMGGGGAGRILLVVMMDIGLVCERLGMPNSNRMVSAAR